MDLDWQYWFNARDQRGNHYTVRSQGNTWTWKAWETDSQGKQRELGQFGSGEDAKRACEEAASKQ